MCGRLLENLRAFSEQVASVLGTSLLSESALSGFLCSDFDPFLNHLFASRRITAADVARVLDGRPAFVWLAGESSEIIGDLPAAGLAMIAIQGMTAATAEVRPRRRVAGEIVEVRSSAELEGWLEVYFEVFGADSRASNEWHLLHDALGPRGDDTLSLLLANIDQMPAATAAAFYHERAVGLYCFTTRESARRRGLASALIDASHAGARARGIEHAILHATKSGVPVYISAGYHRLRSLSVLVARPSKS
jgi:GNAT superfamily N-acetyltransferase